jgi:hypothetical protein
LSRISLFLTLFTLSCFNVGVAVGTKDSLTIDATRKSASTPRGRGPFPGSASPGHSAGLPIRLNLLVRGSELRPNGMALVDFAITNIGAEPIKLPSSVNQNFGQQTSVLTLWLTSDAIKDRYAIDEGTGHLFKIEIVGTSAELYGLSDNPGTFIELAPNKSMRVHALSGVQLNPGTHSITAHAELLRITNGKSELVGTADSEPVSKALSPSLRTAR